MSNRNRFEALPYKLRKPADDMLARSINALDFLDLKLASQFSEQRLSGKSLSFLNSVRADPPINGGFPLSSRSVRMASAQALIECLVSAALQKQDFRKGNPRLQLVTVKPDIGLVDIANPYFPVALTKNFARRLLSNHALEGLCFLDHCLFSPGRGEAETVLHLHVHGAVSFPPSRRSQHAWTSALSPKRAQLNKLGDNVIDLRRRGNEKRPYLSPADVAGLGWYLSKETCGANTIFQTKKGQKSEGSFTDWTVAGALRQLELWSHIDFRQACWSHGKTMGVARTSYRRRTFELLDYYEQPRDSVIEAERLYQGRTRVWAEYGNGFAAIDPSSIMATSMASFKPPPWRPGTDAILNHPG